MKKLLLLMMLMSTVTFARDIQFSSPRHGEKIKRSLIVRIQPPRHDNADVDVWIEEEHGKEKVVWRGRVNKKNKYTLKVNTSKFKKGRYEVKAEYRIGKDRFFGDVDFWID